MKKMLLIPLITFIVVVISSIVAYQQTSELNKGYLFLDGNQKEVVFDGEYYLLVGNLGMYSETITITEQVDGFLVSIFNANDEIIKENLIVVSEIGETYDPSIIESVISTEKNDVDEFYESLIVINLEEGKIYDFDVSNTENHTDDEELDLVFVNIPEHIYNMKDIMESIAFTSGIFTAVALFVIGAIWYVRKD